MSHIKIKALEACRYLLELDSKQEYPCLTNLKIQKLLYFAECFHMAKTNNEMFEEDFEVWKHGPALEGLHNQLKTFKDAVVSLDTFKEERKNNINSDEKYNAILESLKKTYDYFQNYSGWFLRNLSHSPNDLWFVAKNQGYLKISKEMMKKKYYKNDRLPEINTLFKGNIEELKKKSSPFR